MQQYLTHLIRQWLWVLVFSALATSGTVYWLKKDAPPAYTAKAKLLVGPGIESSNPDLSALRTGGQLMETYAELAATSPFLQTVIDDLGLEQSMERLANMIEVKTNQATQVFTISVTHQDPTLAISIANATAEALVRISPSGGTSPAAILREQTRFQAENLVQTIAEIEGTIKRLESMLVYTSDEGIARFIMDQISVERGRLSDAHSTLAQHYQSLQANPTNQVKLIELALDVQPTGSRLLTEVLVSGLSGLILSMVIVLVYESFDDSIKTGHELSRKHALPLLTTLPNRKMVSGRTRDRLVVHSASESDASEAYRQLGIKLLSRVRALAAEGKEEATHLAVEKPASAWQQSPRVLLIGGVEENDNTGEIAGNLALVLSTAGQRVVLVDANWGPSVIPKKFGISTTWGLADALTAQADELDLVAVEGVPRLSILPFGRVPSNLFELLASKRLEELIKRLKCLASIILISTSFHPSSSSVLLASQVDGAVLVIGQGKTRSHILTEVVANLNSMGIHLFGALLSPPTSDQPLIQPSRSKFS